ncbi:MAG: V-type ATP synthase subunit E [Sphaerochaetaceae bacterium]
MELQIQDLVDSIKKEGIDVAESEAAKIIAEAHQKAKELVDKGNKEASQIVEKAKKEAELLVSSGRAALEQAGRDLILSLRKNIEGHFDRLLEANVAGSFTNANLITLITNIVKADIAPLNESAIDLVKEDAAKLAGKLQENLAKELKEGLEIRPLATLNNGFRLSLKDGSAYYDFSSSEIAQLLKPFLNPTLQEIISAAKEQK